ncbi:citrate lyase acyl carrier protein [Vagococcus penaei]|uniref:Citrate lyase acyl carrier protein n=1 Tax=Vagococcus penaei TaxID=633807 RepID=A0A1Q2D7Z6_9ENTE|nr:citrate lyase acyl carrier protein [Vagococcus penaei]AQP54528.1 citrate lyase acyl carrier protein [Vagococcus penaei]RSU06764.1 citrate lyase acyl carrier protein [Vagococcus penaei]
MEIIKNAVAGTVESSDIMITVEPNTVNEVNISLDSSVEKQFGKQIRQVITDTLEKLGVTSIKVIAVDKGALDCTIQARTITAVYRATNADKFDWKEINSWNA